jgi:glycosyltransferase involved in cell wall biosynthesis
MFFESHPIQYRAPIFQALEKLRPGAFEVVFASDFSMRGYLDRSFQTTLKWDVPLLEGYPNRVLENKTGFPENDWRGLSGRGVDRLIGKARPAAVMLHSLSYRFSWAAYLAAVRRGIPVWLRVETQEEATERSARKEVMRNIAYRMVYRGVAKGFYIGKLNKEHLLKFGMADKDLYPARYCTADRMAGWSVDEKIRIRAELRSEIGLGDGHVALGFFGKLIEKKNPKLLLEAVGRLPEALKQKIACVFVGSGPLEGELREKANRLAQASGVKTHFAGFVNQAAIDRYYLATDIAVLPSRRMGETWGLVTNEALHAGCAVAISDAVGCYRDFGDFERVEVFRSEDSAGLAAAIEKLAAYPRDFDWAGAVMRDYSVEAAARSIAEQIDRL